MTTPRRRVVLAISSAVLVAACAGQAERPARVVIPSGASFRVAAESLASHGVIRFPRLFARYAAASGRDRAMKAGTYQFERSQSWAEILDALASGRGLFHSVTIPEGWSIRRIVPQLAKALELSQDSLEAAVRDTALLRELDVPTPTLEGYLFPDTYQFAPGTTAREAVATMVARFQDVWKPEWTERGRQMAMSRHDLVTLAAIVEAEARAAEERPVISAVYHNRLRIGMRLQADPTVLYALGRGADRVLYRDLTVDSKYNTYRYAGLPPGPIASPGAASIDAAANPASVPYLYFVARSDGRHEFRTTFREHTEAIRQIRRAQRATVTGRF